MKALRNKKTGEWLAGMDRDGVYTGNAPALYNNPESVEHIQQISRYEYDTGDIDLSDYELVDVVVIEKADHDKLVDLAYAYKQLTGQ